MIDNYSYSILNISDSALYDLIIVGGGTAGSVIANRLTENEKINVLLIEAGGDPPLESTFPSTMLLLKRSKSDWNYTSEKHKYIEQCHQNPYFEMSTGKMLGGSSSLHYQNYGRGLPRDYDTWADIVNDPSWNWSNVLPLFIQNENLDDQTTLNSSDGTFHSHKGNLGIKKDRRGHINTYLQAFEELGNEIVPEINEQHTVGYTELLLTIKDGYRQSSAYSFLRLVKDRPNLHVMKNSEVTKVLIDENNVAYGVQVVNDKGETITIKASKEVIVSAGVFNTVQLLMLSGIGPKEHLESMGIKVLADLPVGKNLKDHVAISMLHTLEPIADDPIKSYNYHENPAPQFTGYVALDKSKRDPDYLTMSFLVDPEMILSFGAFGYRYSYEICDEIYKIGRDRRMVFHQIINLHQKSTGEVTLRSSNPFDPPVIKLGYLAEEEDLDNLVKHLQDFSKVVDTKHFKSINSQMVDPTGSKCDSFEGGSEEYWKCYSKCMLTGVSHYVGTCAMGSVVDSELKVYNVKNLRVADASVMPTVPSGPPGAAVIMIAEKLAQFIKKDYDLL
ncbi:hypothetical protein K1T71_006937 [Dendrolimus kikuchii]|uniref:Uncharacterized protein n=1 Tax=Dendrolimus kikuchii TaxID=765133 RepID=A0ACC1CZ57_9NEOP|nr:hypothetical protein K1T71_006937 [Dendrolimus kikuchii]